ncbi:MAG: hypothetical protein IPO81_21820 [Kouleothrix sp.]|nr:hypothetical protein [Kouleothrix sp.]
MYRALGSTEPESAQRARAQGMHNRAREIERMLQVGSFDTMIRQRESELQALRQRKSLLENELQRLRRALSELAEA